MQKSLELSPLRLFNQYLIHIMLPEDQFLNTGITPLKVDLGSQPLDRYAASQAAMSGNHWHKHMLRQVGSWVAKGNTDQEIHVLAAAHTLPGYTVEQTTVDVQKMINGARLKGFDKKPNSSAPTTAPLPRQILTMIGDIEIKDPDYLIDGTIETPSLIGLIGPSGSGKTFVALDMAIHTYIEVSYQ